jgi:hypothetical protein
MVTGIRPFGSLEALRFWRLGRTVAKALGMSRASAYRVLIMIRKGRMVPPAHDAHHAPARSLLGSSSTRSSTSTPLRTSRS